MSTSPSSSDLDVYQRDAQAKREDLTHTIDDLRSRVLDTAADVRERISPDNLKAEARRYAVETGQSWMATIETTARENPLQAIALGAGLAYPLLSVARAIPRPLLFIGAGLALLRTKPGWVPTLPASGDAGLDSGLGNTVRETASNVGRSVRESTDGVRTYAADAVQNASGKVTSVAAKLGDVADTAQTQAGEQLSKLSQAAGDTMARVGGSLQSAVGQASSSTAEAGRQVQAFASRTQDSAAGAFRDSPLVVAGLGAFLGAILAAAIPSTRSEGRLIGGLGVDLKGRVHDLVDQGLQSATAAASDAYDRVAGAAEDEGLTMDKAHETVGRAQQAVGSVIDQALGSDDHAVDENGPHPTKAG